MLPTDAGRFQTNFAGAANFSTTKAQTRYLPKNFKPAYLQAFRLSVQQEMPWDTALEISYAGNRTVHEATLQDFNQARTCLLDEVPAGAPGQCNTSLLNRRPLANITGILTYSNAPLQPWSVPYQLVHVVTWHRSCIGRPGDAKWRQRADQQLQPRRDRGPLGL